MTSKIWFGITCISTFVLLSCAGRILQVDKADEALRLDEYDKKVEIKEAPVLAPPPAPVVEPVPIVSPTAPPKTETAVVSNEKAKPKRAKPRVEKRAEKEKKPMKRQPEIEDAAGFEGRRPLKDPFRVGEKIVFDVSYFNIVAGSIAMEVKPFAMVNGQKAYQFEITGRSNSFFSHIYEVDDHAITYLSYDEMVPLSLQISIKESKQLAESRTFFDWKKNKANYWQKRITKEKGERSKKIDWDIPLFSQNVITAPYYLRIFQLEPGKKLAFRVADEGKNIVFTGEVLKREILSTPIGDLKTVVVRPQVTADGIFTPIGDIKLWLTDDDRKFLVRLESKIKIGTVVAKLKSIEKGLD